MEKYGEKINDPRTFFQNIMMTETTQTHLREVWEWERPLAQGSSDCFQQTTPQSAENGGKCPDY